MFEKIRWPIVVTGCLLVACSAPAVPQTGEGVEQPTRGAAPSATVGGPTATVRGDIHPATLAGSWYPGEPDALADSVDAMLDAVTPVDGEPVGLLVPHAGHVYSGPVAAFGFKQIEGVDYEAVIIIGPNHQDAAFSDISVWAEGGFETPLGVVPVNQEVAAELLDADARFVFDRDVHLMEHSIEIQLPFLQRVCPGCAIVPVVVGRPTEGNIEALGDALSAVLASHKVLIIASSDLSHYPSYEDARLVDSATLAAIETGEAELVRQRIDEVMSLNVPNVATCACGEGPLLAMMRAVKEQGADTVTILSYANSGDSPMGDRTQVVGYGAVMFWHWEPPELSQATKSRLLDIARQAIADQMGGAGTPGAVEMEPGDPVLERRSAVFVTLLQDGELRGCVGQTRAQLPLAEAVQRAAVDAAFGDPRFPPLTPGELNTIRIEISVLSPFRRVVDVEKNIQVGTHGLVIVSGGAQGLLLPQVAVDNGFDREEFLEAVSLKAGLPPNAWREATLYTFTAEVFSEGD
jgi:AmmeMemoRadiSam system protein B/AmmeMemoRadiSam system protein A